MAATLAPDFTQQSAVARPAPRCPSGCEHPDLHEVCLSSWAAELHGRVRCMTGTRSMHPGTDCSPPSLLQIGE